MTPVTFSLTYQRAEEGFRGTKLNEHFLASVGRHLKSLQLLCITSKLFKAKSLATWQEAECLRVRLSIH
jgi:hypothetical protein